jgi:hypothetical protein
MTYSTNHRLSFQTSKEKETSNQKDSLSQNCLYTQGLPKKNLKNISRASVGQTKYPYIQLFLRSGCYSRRLFHRPEEVSLISGLKRKEKLED